MSCRWFFPLRGMAARFRRGATWGAVAAILAVKFPKSFRSPGDAPPTAILCGGVFGTLTIERLLALRKADRRSDRALGVDVGCRYWGRFSSGRGPFPLCGAGCCPANASATTGFMASTIEVGIKMVAPRSLVVS